MDNHRIELTFWNVYCWELRSTIIILGVCRPPAQVSITVADPDPGVCSGEDHDRLSC